MIRLSQNEIDNMLWCLIEQIKRSSIKFDYVVGIENGGIHISKPIARALGIEHRSVKISFYNNETNWPGVVPVVKGNFRWQPNGLLVDDLIDNGRTVEYFKQHYGDITVAVLLWNPRSIKPDFYALEKQDEWVQFPWEKDDVEN